jgi:hypothetical protein
MAGVLHAKYFSALATAQNRPRTAGGAVGGKKRMRERRRGGANVKSLLHNRV